MRRRVATVLVFVTLGSVSLLGLINYAQARALLTSEVGISLQARGEAIARQIDSSIESIQSTASVVAEGPALANDLAAFVDAFEDLDVAAPNADQVDALTAYYETEVIGPIADAGFEAPTTDELLPVTDAGIALQVGLLTEQGGTDGFADSSYAAVYADLHPRLEGLATSLGFAGMLLIDQDGTIVYGTEARPDVGTSLQRGPYRDTALATVVTERLATAPTGDAVFSDFEFYLANRALPTMFSVVALRDEGQFVGAVAFEISIEGLNALTTGDGNWEAVGLGDTGEVYIVGSDQLMRSESRRWLEDPAAYVSALEEAGAAEDVVDRVETLGTTVLVQPVESSVVVDALQGAATTERNVDYLGRRSLTFATPIGSGGLGWAAVAEISDAEATESLRSFRNRLLLVTAILLPVAAALGLIIASRITRPVNPVVDAARSIAAGDLDADLPELGANEFGDVARRLEDLAAHLRDQEAQLEAEEHEITRMLLAALPPRLVERLRAGESGVADLVDTATVISVTISGVFEEPGVDPDVAVEVGARISQRLEDSASRRGIERVRSSSVQHLFVAGLDTPGYEADIAVEFALEACEIVRTEAELDGLDARAHAGLAAGRVVSGLLSGAQLAYTVFGEPVQLALTLDAIAATDGEVLAHESVASILETGWDLEPAKALVDLAGRDLVAARVRQEVGEPLTDG